MTELPEREERAFHVAFEGDHLSVMTSEKGRDLVRRAVPSPDPDHLRRVPEQKASFVKVGILRHDHEGMLGRVPPDGVIVGSLQADLADMR